MAVYDVGGEEYEIPDSVQGEKLQRVLQGIVNRQKQTINIQPSQPASPDVPVIGADGHAVVQQMPEKPDRTVGEMLAGAGETALTLGTGATSGVVGAIGGAARGFAREISNGEFGSQAAANRIAQSSMKGMESLTYAPRTEAGQDYTQAAGQALAPLAAFGPMTGEMTALASGIKQAAPALSDLSKVGTKEAPNRMPLFRAPPQLVDDFGQMTPAFEKALKKQGVDLINVADDIKRLPQDISPERAARDLVTLKLQMKDRDGYLATKRLLPGGVVVDDSLAQEAVKQGFREGDVQAIKVASEGTRQGMRKMLNIRRAIYGDERKGLDMRPADVIGDAAVKRIEHIRNTANQARIELDRIATNELAGKTINVDKIPNNLISELKALDVALDTSTIPPKANYVGSLISKDRAAQKVINDVIDLLSEKKTPDALRAHKLKRQLDTMINYRKNNQGSQGLTKDGQNIVKSVRRSLNEAIREVSEDYGNVNDTLSKSLDAFDDFQGAMGKSIDMFSPDANKAIGQDLRGLMSNRKTRVNLDAALTKIDDTAVELGGQFSDDIRALVMFDKTLDEKFGNTARRGFAGEVESATARGIDIATGGTAGVMKAGVDFVKGEINKRRNINDHQAFKTLDQLIMRKD